MNMVAHDAQGIELTLKFLQYLVEGIQEDVTAFSTIQKKLTIIAAGGDVIAIVRLYLSRFSRHRLKPR